MTNRQATTIASRVLSAWFIYEAVLALAFIPSTILAFSMNSALSHTSAGYAMQGQMSRILMGPALSGLFRLLVDISAALVFYNAGPFILRFLTAG